jgi:uncharacterized protein YdeI (YjbR/CyaY-like superfamily)
MLEATFFATSAEWREWLAAHHDSASECLVGFMKVASGVPSMSWSESVDEAVCFGWIDGVRRRVDEHAYTIRFTPRGPGSIWSAVNVEKMRRLEAAGLMTDAGRKAFDARSAAKTAVYSYERDAADLGEDETRRFQQDAAAWAFFGRQAAWYRRTAVHWVTSAKRDETRNRRLAQLIEDSGAGRRLRHLGRHGVTMVR